MPEGHGDFIWYELMTTDADAAGRFYSAVVPGWTFGERMAGDVDYRGITRSDGGNAGGVLQLDESMRSNGARPMWLGYLNVGDVDEAAASVEQAGGSALVPPFDVPDVGRIAMVADPQGAPLYVMKPIPPADKPDAKSDVFSPSEVQRVSWNELATSDQNSALEFYTTQFGWEKGEAMPMGDMGEYQLMTHHGVQFGAIMTKAADRESRWRFYIRVGDLDSAKAAVETGGGSVLHGPIEVPGGDRVLIGSDPQGAEFALVGK
jgi:predicted enzyme related to lactoylglutathione lyase